MSQSTAADDPPSSKRRRLDETTVTNEEDEEDLTEFLDGEDFVTDEQKQEAEAQRRRQQRRLRLQQLQADEKVDMKVEETQNGPASLNQSTSKSNNNMEISVKGDGDEQESNASDDEFDMFSSSVSPVSDKKEATARNTKRGHEQQDWDDAEGYYKAVIGEIISLDNSSSAAEAATGNGGSISFRVSGLIGKGVFSTVLKATTISNSSSVELPPTVALKCIRHNETMAKAALNELQILRKLKGSPGIVPLLMPTGVAPLEHRGHVIMIFPFMEYNLRDVLQKFGKGVGLSLQAVRSYFGQVLAAATHLQKHGILHLDIKPDNCLVRDDFGVVQIADFGSAIHVDSPEQTNITPYLVSRFYRAPEIILGLAPTHAVDLWSIAVSMAEIFLGDVVFRGKSNNDMLYVFMNHLGAFSNRVIRQHLVQCQRLPIPRHFQQEGANYMFRQETVDPVSGAAVHKVLSLLPQNNNNNKFPLGTPLKQKLLKAKSAKDSKKMVLEFADLLTHCLALDPTRRIATKDALRHEFFQVASKPT